MNIFEKRFHIKERGSSLKTEIIGGLVVFVAMCYILPVNSTILSSMGMDKQGVFAMTALVGALVTLIMGLVANYPVVLSAGMGLNAFIAYTVTEPSTWQQKMIILTLAGLIFFLFSLTPIRKWIVESIPKGLKAAISAGLGCFIAYVGLKNTGVISFIPGDSVTPTLGSLGNPAVIIALIAIFLCFSLMFVKKISNFAVPLAVAFAAICGLCVTCVQYYGMGYDITQLNSALPCLPWVEVSLGNIGFGTKGISEVVFFGALSSTPYTGEAFVNDLAVVFSSPSTYVAVFALMLVNLFDTTATLVAIGGSTGIIADDGTMKDYNKVVLADATGAAICAPLGTSTVTSFVESNVGVQIGARTGLAACVAAIMFALSAFIYPIFAIFTAPSVTAAALMCVGAMIFVNNIKNIDMSDGILAFTSFVIIILSTLTYSISNGIGIGLILYCTMMLITGKYKEVPKAIYTIAGLYILLYILQGVTGMQ